MGDEDVRWDVIFAEDVGERVVLVIDTFGVSSQAVGCAQERTKNGDVAEGSHAFVSSTDLRVGVPDFGGLMGIEQLAHSATDLRSAVDTVVDAVEAEA